MDRDLKVSIIVTVHNSEKYLKQCLESVCRQTLQDIEILCIDGGSMDGSPQILSEYKQKDSRVRIINDSNTGYGHKVNTGIVQAKGKYVSILETDDQYDRSMLEKLFGIAEKYKLDYVDSNFYCFFEFDSMNFKYKVNKYKEGSNYDCMIQNGDLICSTASIWTGLYNKNFLLKEDIKLNESAGASFQDVSFGFQVGIKAQRSYHLSEALYYYRVDNEGSSTNDSKKIYEIVYEYEYLKECLNNEKTNTQKVWNKYYLEKYRSFLWNAGRLSGSAREEFLRMYLDEIQKDLKNGDISKDFLVSPEGESVGLVYTNYHEFLRKLEESDRNNDYRSIIKMVKDIGENDIVVFGGGRRGEQIINLYSDKKQQIKCICDNSNEIQGSKKYGYNVLSVRDAIVKYPAAIYIIANFLNSEEMRQQLLHSGIPEKNIYIYKRSL